MWAILDWQSYFNCSIISAIVGNNNSIIDNWINDISIRILMLIPNIEINKQIFRVNF